MLYNKPPLTIRKQVELLESRKLEISDKPFAESVLSRINYYRLSPFCIPFETSRHCFRNDATFERVYRLYRHDDILRSALSDVLRNLEIYFRTQLTYTLTTEYNNPFIHYDTNIFLDSEKHTVWISKVEKEIKRSKEDFVKHYQNKYEGFPKLPLWIATETMTFNQVSWFFKILSFEARSKVSVADSIPIHQSVFGSWLHTMTYLRNICAHHARIANRKLAIRPALPRKDKRWRGLSPERLYASAVMLEYIIRAGNLALAPIKKLYAAMKALLDDEPWFARQMGVPRNWDGSMYWKGEQEL